MRQRPFRGSAKVRRGSIHSTRLLCCALAFWSASWCLPLAAWAEDGSGETLGAELRYVKKSTRAATEAASLATSLGIEMPTTWEMVGPFAAHGGQALDRVYPPEKRLDLEAEYDGTDGPVRWQELKLPDGKVHKLNKLFPRRDDRVCFLYRRIESRQARVLRVSLGFDDALAVFLNGKRLLARPNADGAYPDQEFVSLPLRAGTNDLLLKLANRDKDWAFYFQPTLSEHALAILARRLDADFPPAGEAAHYRIERLPLPDDAVIEVGGLAFDDEGRLFVGTRRGDVWLVKRPLSDNPDDIEFQRFATGLHEVLGVASVGPGAVVVAQRPELTLVRDHDRDDVADEYQTVCDRFGISGDYHEFHYGPARDAAGNWFVSLNLSLASGHYSRVPYRGFVMQISPGGATSPVAYGFRSPNGLGFDPEGRLFCTDNQGEWIPTCKLQEVRPGEYYGHPASARWAQGRDGEAPPVMVPPAVWLPFGTCRSATEPIWDRSGGRFGPFAGQCFLGELTNSLVLRVMLEEVGGRMQGACIQFRKGFGSGVNRLAQAPDGSLFVGQTNRGWGSLGGRPHGLDRVVFTGKVPLELSAMHVRRDGWELRFSLPLARDAAENGANYVIDSYTYHHWDKYGSPEIDRRSTAVTGVDVSADARTVRLATSDLETGRVYRLRLDNLSAAQGGPLLHREACYTLNALP